MIIKVIIKFVNSTKNHQVQAYFSNQISASNLVYLTKQTKPI